VLLDEREAVAVHLLGDVMVVLGRNPHPPEFDGLLDSTERTRPCTSAEAVAAVDK
jgi:hypothetical protein